MVREGRLGEGEGTRVRRGALALLAAVGLVLVGCAGGPRTAPGGETAACGPCAPAGQMPECPPPEAAAGEAWCRVWVPEEYGVIQETYCVKPESCRKEWVPPRYGSRPKLVCVQDSQLREHVTPAQWGCQQREVMVCPPQEGWKRICCPSNPGLGPCEVQGECWTKVERPAVYANEDCPVCVAPERRCVEYQPAQYKVVEERFLLEPGRCIEVREPAQFATRCRQVCVRPGRWEWRRNETCEVPPCFPPPPLELPSLQVEMTDKTQEGMEQGIFAVGDTVRYDLVIASDESDAQLPPMNVVFTLPPELEFVSGNGDGGIQVLGAGQNAKTTDFQVPVGGSVTVRMIVRVMQVPPTNLVQLTASVRTAAGEELVEERESTTLRPSR